MSEAVQTGETGGGWRHWLARAAFESALIVFSVFLALVLDGWRQNHETAAKVRDVRAYFAEEIRANRADLASPAYAPLHLRAAQAWARLSALPHPTVADLSATWSSSVPEGFHPFQPRDAVWRSFSSSDLMQHMPSREVFALADVYRTQEQLAVLDRALLSNVLIPSADAQKPAFIASQADVVHSNLTDIRYTELALAADYDRALTLLGDKGKTP